MKKARSVVREARDNPKGFNRCRGWKCAAAGHSRSSVEADPEVVREASRPATGLAGAIQPRGRRDE